MEKMSSKDLLKDFLENYRFILECQVPDGRLFGWSAFEQSCMALFLNRDQKQLYIDFFDTIIMDACIKYEAALELPSHPKG